MAQGPKDLDRECHNAAELIRHAYRAASLPRESMTRDAYRRYVHGLVSTG